MSDSVGAQPFLASSLLYHHTLPSDALGAALKCNDTPHDHHLRNCEGSERWGYSSVDYGNIEQHPFFPISTACCLTLHQSIVWRLSGVEQP